jgi:hypothetical protein
MDFDDNPPERGRRTVVIYRTPQKSLRGEDKSQINKLMYSTREADLLQEILKFIVKHQPTYVKTKITAHLIFKSSAFTIVSIYRNSTLLFPTYFKIGY